MCTKSLHKYYPCYCHNSAMSRKCRYISSHLTKEEINTWRNQIAHVVCKGSERAQKRTQASVSSPGLTSTPSKGVPRREPCGSWGHPYTPVLSRGANLEIPARPGSCWPIWWVPNTIRIFLTWASCELTNISLACKDHWFFFSFFNLFILYWGTANQQCCGSFRWTAKGLSPTCTWIHSSPTSPPIQAAT